MLRRTAMLAALLLALVAVGAADGTPTAATAQPAPGGPPDPSALAPLDCARAGFRDADPLRPVCGFITVSEDHERPENGRTIELAVAVVPATGPRRQPDPIVYLQGGPGVDIVFAARTLASLFAGALADRDLVVIDQRGTGLSRPSLACPEVTDFALEHLAWAGDDEGYMRDYFAALRRCWDRLADTGIDLAAYTSAQNAADVVAVSRALGYPRINVFGISYGARLALTVARDAGPSGYIRSATIGGVYDIEARALELTANFNEALSRVFEACATDRACNDAYPDLRTVYYTLLDRLRDAPVPLEFQSARTGMRWPVRGDDNLLLWATFGAMVRSRGVAEIPAGLYGLLAGDTDFLDWGIDTRLAEYAGTAWGMNTAVQCRDDFLLTAPERAALAEAMIPPAMRGFAERFPENSPLMPDFCRSLGLAPRPSLEKEGFASDVPILAISGWFDPFTPPSWAARGTRGFRTRYRYTLMNAGHDSAQANPCALSLVEQFLADPTRAPDAACVLATGGPDWDFPSGDR